MHTLDTWVKAGYPTKRTLHIPNGVDFDRFRPVDREARLACRDRLGLPRDATILVWVGRVQRSMKGADRIEQIASLLPERTVLAVVGDGPEFEGMQKNCKSLLEDGKLFMPGATPTPEDYYRAADAFLFTSYHEPFGLVILEAVASGLPILSFPVSAGGGAVDLLSEFDAVEIHEPVDRERVAEATDRVLLRGARAQEQRAAAASKYSWELISARVVDAYRSVLNSSFDSTGKMEVLVCQHGARHRYSVPRILEQAGMLCAFYTDSSAESLLGKCIKLFGSHVPKKWQHFARWDIHGIPSKKVYSSDYSQWPEMWQRLVKAKKTGIYLYQQRHQRLSLKMIGWGLKGANVVYSMYHENLDFVHWAKKKGARSVVDVFVSPVTSEILQKECEVFPDWGDVYDHQAAILERRMWKRTADMADMLLCPSEWVADGVRRITPMAADKIKVVPYGCSIDFRGKTNTPIKGRVLFAGRDPLRKGLHYLAIAATRLKEDFPEIEVRIAGAMPPHVVEHPLCKDLNFLGQLNSTEMEEEYLSADVFVLAALSEGFAGVVAEAIGAGCPVVVTREAGSPVVDEREGLVIPARDPDALVDAIRRMVSDRVFRDKCSANCLEQADFYSEASWSYRLLAALRECYYKRW
jgi:glycosyltransferase involved in cell wall biosynthesis